MDKQTNGSEFIYRTNLPKSVGPKIILYPETNFFLLLMLKLFMRGHMPMFEQNYENWSQNVLLGPKNPENFWNPKIIPFQSRLIGIPPPPPPDSYDSNTPRAILAEG